MQQTGLGDNWGNSMWSGKQESAGAATPRQWGLGGKKMGPETRGHEPQATQARRHDRHDGRFWLLAARYGSGLG